MAEENPTNVPKAGRLSTVSSKYDSSGKGYLDAEESRLRQYDTNDDGKLDLEEMKNVMTDLIKKEKKEKQWRTFTILIAIFLLLSVVCNFGTVWTA